MDRKTEITHLELAEQGTDLTCGLNIPTLFHYPPLSPRAALCAALCWVLGGKGKAWGQPGQTNRQDT